MVLVTVELLLGNFSHPSEGIILNLFCTSSYIVHVAETVPPFHSCGLVEG